MATGAIWKILAKLSLLRSRAICVSLRSVMSREMPNVPTTRPAASRSGILVVETHALGRSVQVSRSSRFSIGCPVRMISCSSFQAASA